jgi:hypothetical protein
MDTWAAIQDVAPGAGGPHEKYVGLSLQNVNMSNDFVLCVRARVELKVILCSHVSDLGSTASGLRVGFVSEVLIVLSYSGFLSSHLFLH